MFYIIIGLDLANICSKFSENLPDCVIEQQKKTFFDHILTNKNSFYHFEGINPCDLWPSSFVTFGNIKRKYPYEYHYQNLYSIKGFKFYWRLNQEILWYFQGKNTLYNRKIKGNINL